MALPPRRKPVKSGIARAEQRVWPRHQKWLRGFQCCVSRISAQCDGRVEVSHIRTAANSGTGIKPHDGFAVPMCTHHHQLYHSQGHDWFERTYGVRLLKLADEFVWRSPDIRMRDSYEEIHDKAAAREDV